MLSMIVNMFIVIVMLFIMFLFCVRMVILGEL